jgi:hypothetical protein
MRCPTCHEDYATQAGFQAHVPNCAYKDNPLPEPEIKAAGDGLEHMKAGDLKTMAEGLGIEGFDKMKKPELIEAIRAVNASGSDAE